MTKSLSLRLIGSADQTEGLDPKQQEIVERMIDLNWSAVDLGELRSRVDPDMPRFRMPHDLSDALISQAIDAYERHGSSTAAAEEISAEIGKLISPQQIRAIMEKAKQGRRLRPRNPLPYAFVRDAEGADPRRVEKRFEDLLDELPRSEIGPELRRYVTKNSRKMLRMYTDLEPWNSPDILNNLTRYILDYHHAQSSALAGFNFENAFFLAAKDAPGYDAELPANSNNKGEDLRVMLANEKVLTNFSLKSSAARGKSSGKSIEISALAPHEVGHVPKTIAETRDALRAASEHVDHYQRIAYLECIKGERFPGSEAEAWRYNVIEIPREQISKALEQVSDAEIDAALEKITKGGKKGQRVNVVIPIHDEEGNKLFHIHIGKDGVAITAIAPRFYQLQSSVWTEPGTVERAQEALFEASTEPVKDFLRGEARPRGP